MRQWSRFTGASGHQGLGKPPGGVPSLKRASGFGRLEVASDPTGRRLTEPRSGQGCFEESRTWNWSRWGRFGGPERYRKGRWDGKYGVWEPPRSFRKPVRKIWSLFMSEASITVQLLHSADRLREPAIVSAVQSLPLPKGSHGLDAGCGIGSHCELLLKATAPDGHLTGLDSSSEHLAVAVDTARQRGISSRVSFRQGDVADPPFEANSFDWAWSVDCVGFIPGDPVEMIRGLARVVKPGGIVALLLWSSQQLLPGYPFLEARLNGTRAGAAPATADWPPRRHPLRSIGWLASAGLREPAARTFVVDIFAPLHEDQKLALASLIEMRWGSPDSELSEADREVFQRLKDRAHPDSVVDGEDYFGFFTYSLFWGVVPGETTLHSAPE